MLKDLLQTCANGAWRRWAAAAVLASTLGGCAGGGASSDGALIADPFEPWNRAMHQGNRVADAVVLRPLAQGYDLVTPDLVKHLVGNGLDYLSQPRTLINQLLQGDFEGAGDTSARIFVNGVMGLGVLDPATEFGIPNHDRDFGQTLASWGVGEGYYHEFLFFGPYTTRGTAGWVVDMAFDPLRYVGPGLGFSAVQETTVSATRGVLGVARFRSENMSIVDQVLASPDSYATTRSAFVQRRRASLRRTGDPVDLEALPDIYGDYDGEDF